jgi:hypothetical protein
LVRNMFIDLFLHVLLVTSLMFPIVVVGFSMWRVYA